MIALLGIFLLAPLLAHAAFPQGFPSVIVDNFRVNEHGGGGRGMDNDQAYRQANISRSAENQKSRCDRLRDHGKKIIAKYQQRIERLNKYLERVQSRRSKLQSQGKDVSKIDKKVTDIKAHIAQEQSVINQEQPTLTTVNCTGDLKVQAQAMRTSMQKIHQSFSEGNHFLQDIVHELRETTIHR